MCNVRRALTFTLTAAMSLGLASAASADSLVQSAPGARNLAAGGGYLVWAAPAEAGRWKLVVRAPDGKVTTPAIPTFGALPDPAVGSDRGAIAARRLLTVYSRCAGTSAVSGCDVFALNVLTGREERVTRLSTRAYSETNPQIALGALTAVRRGGPRPGVYSFGSGVRAARRLTRFVPAEIAASASRVVTAERTANGYQIVLRQRSGDGTPRVLASDVPARPRSLTITRYRAGWLAGAQAFQTTRFAGSSGVVFNPAPQQGNRELPASVDSIANNSSIVNWYLDGEGVKLLDPRLFG